MSILVKLVGHGIGLTAEAKQYRKDKKAREASSSNSCAASPFESSSDDPPVYAELPPDDAKALIASGDAVPVERHEDGDEKDWDLDDAAEEADPDAEQRTQKESNDAFAIALARLPPPDLTKKLPCAVILPQRRPRAKARGFVKAYAPVLLETGIDQTTFLAFLSAWEKSSKDVQSRARRNSFLDDANTKLFMPRGLYCMVMRFAPDSAHAVESTSVNANDAIARYASAAGSGLTSKLRMASGKTHGEIALPEAAPLVFPALDHALAAGGDRKRDRLKRGSEFVNEYKDRRAQAVYGDAHPESRLAARERPRFASVYSDPAHPASSGDLLALVSKGRMTMPRREGGGGLGGGGFGGGRGGGLGGLVGEVVGAVSGRGRDSEQQHESQTYVLSQGGVFGGGGGRGGGLGQGGLLGTGVGKEVVGAGPLGAVKRIMRQDVLYLLIVNMPSEREIAEARARLGMEV
ncbi:uncharacterized protein BDZ99DRAFT_437263 [Mytilinidion resinicola]|uniref:Uncharacterized protein n=1 Tax=Mytilinidion resinicola TaxID=574789 RepID=A0A6A6YZL1_9PEZI|nr:uncharacterized protein BDZ99DRAFT_437263 [Mytilinidion resinicola]KAF2814362.1 hypothetical protein BDZ99DRAFT_437263 [Mytilinidion resinicola]